jgi:hypothetical protein
LNTFGGVEKPVEAAEPRLRQQKNRASKQYNIIEERMKKVLELNKTGKKRRLELTKQAIYFINMA